MLLRSQNSTRHPENPSVYGVRLSRSVVTLTSRLRCFPCAFYRWLLLSRFALPNGSIKRSLQLVSTSRSEGTRDSRSAVGWDVTRLLERKPGNHTVVRKAQNLSKAAEVNTDQCRSPLPHVCIHRGEEDKPLVWRALSALA